MQSISPEHPNPQAIGRYLEWRAAMIADGYPPESLAAVSRFLVGERVLEIQADGTTKCVGTVCPEPP